MQQEIDARKSKMTGEVYMSGADLKLREWDSPDPNSSAT